MNATKLLSDIYRSYLFKNLVGDLSKLARKSLKNIDFDRDAWLHKAGLTTYRPGRSVLSGSGLFLLGIVAGGAAALAFATKTGPEFRADVADKARDLIDKANVKMTSISEGTQQSARA
ncbi:MAG: YtxH domain-containing protein [Myxococcaceae bacterium]